MPAGTPFVTRILDAAGRAKPVLQEPGGAVDEVALVPGVCRVRAAEVDDTAAARPEIKSVAEIDGLEKRPVIS